MSSAENPGNLGIEDILRDILPNSVGEAANSLASDDAGTSVEEWPAPLETTSAATQVQISKTIEREDDSGATLEKVTEGRYLSVEAMNEALKGLQDVNVEIPEAEIVRLKDLYPAKISEANMAKMETMKAQSEGEKGLMVMQLPAKIMVDGKEEPFTIATMQAVMQKATNLDSKQLSISSYVPGSVKNKVWSSDLRAWTSTCLKGSRNKDYQTQLADQTKVLGNESQIDADMFLAMLMLYISSKEKLMPQAENMRLNVSANHWHQGLQFEVINNTLRLEPSHPTERYSHVGIGASFPLSS